MRKQRILIGLMIWAASVYALWWISRSSPGASSTAARLVPELRSYWLGQERHVALRFHDPTDVTVGDPIFLLDQSGTMRRVGEVRELLEHGATLPRRRGQIMEARAVLYPTGPRTIAGARLTHFTTPNSIPWVVNTLLTPERKQLVADELRTVIDEHQQELMAALRPVLENTIRDSWSVAEQELPEVLERHRGEIESLGAKYEREIVNQELVPLVRREIWPIVRRNAEPTVNRIGMELWERVSLWRFAWRAAYDRSPLPERHLMEEEWGRFVRQEAMPILARHTDDFVAVIRSVIRDASNNDAVRAAVRHSLSTVANDPEFQEMLQDVVHETFFENSQMRQAIERNWTSAEAQDALSVVTERLEPTVHRIADLLFGTLETGITPEFAQVLRTQILAKDRQWFLLEVEVEPMEDPQPGHEPVLWVHRTPSAPYKTAALVVPRVQP